MFCRKTAAAIDTDGFIAVPNGERIVIVEVDCGRVSEYKDITFRNRVAFVPTFPNCKLCRRIVKTTVRAIVLKGRAVDEFVFLTVYFDVYIERERIEMRECHSPKDSEYSISHSFLTSPSLCIFCKRSSSAYFKDNQESRYGRLSSEKAISISLIITVIVRESKILRYLRINLISCFW